MQWKDRIVALDLLYSVESYSIWNIGIWIESINMEKLIIDFVPGCSCREENIAAI
jgi:multisubunit Na+/H+ antiporter MnhF subunit